MPLQAGIRTGLKHQQKLLSICQAFILLLPVRILPGQTTPLPEALNIVVVEGEGAVNNIAQRIAHNPTVRVEDESHKPLTGAVVVFTLPTEGATGEFLNGSKSLTVATDSEGVAKAQGMKLNPVGGKMPIHVSASYRGLSTRTTIMQLIEVPPGTKIKSGGGNGKLIAILAVIGAAAGGGAAYAATRKSGGSTAAPPAGPAAIGITAGAGAITPPH
jgi:hypothetical protein